MLFPSRQMFFLQAMYGLLCFLAICVAASAQDGIDSARGQRSQPIVSAPVDSAIPLIRQAPLDAVVVFSPNGKQQIHLPGWRLEDLDEIRERRLEKRQSPNPSFILQEIIATGHVVDN